MKRLVESVEGGGRIVVEDEDLEDDADIEGREAEDGRISSLQRFTPLNKGG